MMLNKDINQRASIFDIAKVPCMKRQILKWVETHNCKEEVQSFYDMDQQFSQMDPEPNNAQENFSKMEKSIKPKEIPT
jgi:hypothetical protein